MAHRISTTKKFRGLVAATGALLAGGLLLTGCSGAGSSMDGVYIGTEESTNTAVIEGDQIKLIDPGAGSGSQIIVDLKAVIDEDFDSLSDESVLATGTIKELNDAHTVRWDRDDRKGHGFSMGNDLERLPDTLKVGGDSYYLVGSDAAADQMKNRDERLVQWTEKFSD